jgi:hypothetical protein
MNTPPPQSCAHSPLFHTALILKRTRLSYSAFHGCRLRKRWIFLLPGYKDAWKNGGMLHTFLISTLDWSFRPLFTGEKVSRVNWIGGWVSLGGRVDISRNRNHIPSFGLQSCTVPSEFSRPSGYWCKFGTFIVLCYECVCVCVCVCARERAYPPM